MKSFQEKAKNIFQQAKNFEKNEDKGSKKLPSDCWFLDKSSILAYKRELGDARYPYAQDGMTLWAYSSGNISVEESLFNIFLDSREGKEPYVCFFAGQKQEDGFFPVSLLGTARQPIEKGIKRYTVYTPEAVYYFTETDYIFAVVRMFVDAKKRICFSTYIENNSSKEVETYISAYFNPFLRHAEAEDFECKWYKSCSYHDGLFSFKVTEYLGRENCLTHYALIQTSGTEGMKTTTSRFDFTGGMNESLNCSMPLQKGHFGRGKAYTGFTDMAIAGSIHTLTLKAGESHREDYVLTVSDDETIIKNPLNATMGMPFELDQEIFEAGEKRKNAAANKLSISFSGLSDALKGRDEVFNNFIYNVVRQTEFCARAKNYAGPFIGIRDIFQQVEAAIAWIPEYCRRKIVEALNFIGDNGRAPRQYSYPANEWTPPKMDLRAFIDQGVWIISTVYTYLCYTGDYSILDEVCGYYKFVGNTVQLCDKKDTVLDHLILITDYLISNLDTDTGCLKALYGDWNDALDGLGKTTKEGQEFGNGVSVMASLQLYRNLAEMSDVLRKKGVNVSKAEEYLKVRAQLEKSLIKNAIVANAEGERKILHGWGENRSWFVGSYCDNDGFSRDGLTASAYWILSGMYKACGEVVPDILNAYARLDSKYGLKTFEPYFSSANDKVGRINRLPKGTAENGATYIHATLFGIWSLFELGEGKHAWEQIYKILPITHDYISTTPFVMPNSYVYNEEMGFDGESMNDWFTGSGCVLMKVIFGGIFGVRPTLDGVGIRMNSYMPTRNAEISLNVKGCIFHLKYSDKGIGERRYYINGVQEEQIDNAGIFIQDEKLSTKLIIEIID